MKYVIASARQLLDHHGQDILQFEEAYATYFASLGYQLLVLPAQTNICVIERLDPDLVLLTGGGDVPAEYYNSDIKVVAQHERDLLENAMIEFAMKHHVPLLGICRGMQMINGFLGGELTRNNENTHPIAVSHRIHIFDCIDADCVVNSYHRDVIQRNLLSKELKAIATHQTQNHVEAFVGITRHILGIQWHPERMGKASACRKFSDILINRLIEGVLT